MNTGKMELPNLDFNHENPEESFDRIANELLNHWLIKIQKSSFRICEIEFYLHGPGHEDPYSHKHPIQKSKGRWYMHPSGMDITFGNDQYYGGILIRAIENCSKEQYIYGPLNSVTAIFEELPYINESPIEFYLIRDHQNTLSKEEVIKAPRVGLNPAKNENYSNKFYRYLIFAKKKHAEKTNIAEAMSSLGLPQDMIKNIWG